jgi:anti-sigma regulatory factor (Ser/Thr protein kinase)
MQISLNLPDEAMTVPLCRRVLRIVLQELEVPEEQAADIELVLGEAAGNVIRHAYEHPGQEYRVVLEFRPQCVRLTVTDSGGGFQPKSVLDPDVEQVSGRGIWLIEQLADVATIRATPAGGCCLEAEFHVPLSLPTGKELPTAGGDTGAYPDRGWDRRDW